MPKKKPAKNQMLKKCKDDLSSISTHRKSWNIRKTKDISKSVTVPKQFKTPGDIRIYANKCRFHSTVSIKHCLSHRVKLR